MRILVSVGGILSLMLAVAFCAPVVVLVRQDIICRRAARNVTFTDVVSGTYPHNPNPRELAVSVGPVTLFGWRLWAAVGILALVGILFAGLGVYALLFQKSGS